MKFSNILYYALHPKDIFLVLASHGLVPMDDKTFIEKQFKKLMGYDLDFENPKTFDEKLNWLKIHNRNPQYIQLVDKYEVKKYISDIIGSQYIIPTIGVYDSFNEIDFDLLPNQFVLKCTHDSGGLVMLLIS